MKICPTVWNGADKPENQKGWLIENGIFEL